MPPPRAAVEARNRRVRAMLHVLRARIHNEKFELRTADLVRSCLRVVEGRQDCDHAARKCMCFVLRERMDRDAESDQGAASSEDSSSV